MIPAACTGPGKTIRWLVQHLPQTPATRPAPFDYLRDLPPAQQQARRALHDALDDATATEKAARAARRERRTISQRTVINLAPLDRAPHRGGGLCM